jgi:solute:Na+ symporter, SSS family
MYPTPDDPRVLAVTMLITIVTTTILWVAVTYMTGPEPDDTLDAFYLRVRPGGPGWAHVSKRLGFGRERTPGGALAWTNWLAGVIAVYATLFGIGKLIFGEIGAAAVLIVVGIAAFAWIARSFRTEEMPPPDPGVRAQPVAAD